MPVHFPSESGLPAETTHGRSNGRAPDSVRLGFPLRDTNTGAGQDFTDLAAAVQLRLRVAFGSQTLIVKLRLLPGWNTVRIRGDPPISTLPQLKHRSAALRTRRLQVGFLPGVPVSRRVSPTRRGAPLRTGRLWVQILHAAPICPRSPTQRQRT